MPNIPLVSVIMPLYNKRPYVRRAIDSVSRQSFSDWELIIVDDGSTDGSTAEIPQEDPRIRLFQQENAGPGAARNLGISMALGTFVTFIDADNLYYPYKLEKKMTLLGYDKKLEWVVSAFDFQLRDKIAFQPFLDLNGDELKGRPFVCDSALNHLTIAGWHIEGLLVRNDLLQRVGGFREDMRCYEITEFFVRCALTQPTVLVYPSPLFCVVDVPESAFKVSTHRIEGLRQIGESLYNLSKDYPEFSKYLVHRSQKAMLYHVASLIKAGKTNEARGYLTKRFPYTRNKRWWKLWTASWLPIWFIARHIDNRIRKNLA